MADQAAFGELFLRGVHAIQMTWKWDEAASNTSMMYRLLTTTVRQLTSDPEWMT